MAAPPTYRPAYRATVYAPRSVDATEQTVLTPAAGAPHSDKFQIASVQGLAGWQPYLDTPRGRRSIIDPLSKQVDVGELTVRVLDKRAGANSDNLTRWLSTFLGDGNGTNQLIGRKVKLEECLDYDEATGTGAFHSFFTGRISAVRSSGRLWFELVLREMNDDLDVDVFVAAPHPNADYACRQQVWPLGSQLFYFPSLPVWGAPVWLTVTERPDDAGFSATYDASTPDDYGQSLKRLLVSAGLHDHANAGGPNLVANVTVRGAGTKSRWRLVSYAGSNSVTGLALTALPDGSSGVAPQIGDGLEVSIVPDGLPVSEELPIVIGPVHPVKLWRNLLDGYFSRLLPDGSVGWALPYDANAFDALQADASYGTVRGVITEGAKLGPWLEDQILKVFHLAYYLDADGRVVPVDCRRKATITPVATLTSADLDPENPPAWEQTQDGVTAVEFTYYAERWIPDEELPATGQTVGDGYTYPANAARIAEVTDYVLLLEEFGDRAMDVKASTLKVDAKLLRFRYSKPNEYFQERESDGTLRADALAARALAFADEMKAPFGTGATYFTVTALRSSANQGAVLPGKWAVAQVDEIPDPVTHKRGGPRLGFCVQRSEDGPRVQLRFLDAGENSVAAPPTIGVPTITGSGANVLSVPVTVDAAGDPVVIWYARTDTATAQAPAEDSKLWIRAGGPAVTASGTFSVRFRDALSNTRVWVRGRSQPRNDTHYKLPSQWAFAAAPGYVDGPTFGAPTNLVAVAGSETSTSIALTWDNPNGYLVAIYLVQGAAPASWTEDKRVLTLGAGAVKVTLTGLAGPTVQHTVGVAFVRATDGAESPIANLTFTTGAGDTSAPRPVGLATSGWILDANPWVPSVPLL